MLKTTNPYLLFIFVFVLGLLPVSLQTSFEQASNPGADADLFLGDETIRTGTIEPLYQDWKRRYLEAGGDREVIISLGPIKGFSPVQKARGWMRLDLIAGDVTVQIEELTEASDVWLVDDQPGSGKGLLLEEKDRMVRLGRLGPSTDGVELNRSLGKDFFKEFELDLVVVSPAGVSPMETQILIGSRTSFERRHTRERLAFKNGMSASPNSPSSEKELSYTN